MHGDEPRRESITNGIVKSDDAAQAVMSPTGATSPLASIEKDIRRTAARTAGDQHQPHDHTPAAGERQRHTESDERQGATSRPANPATTAADEEHPAKAGFAVRFRCRAETSARSGQKYDPNGIHSEPTLKSLSGNPSGFFGCGNMRRFELQTSCFIEYICRKTN